MKKQIYAITTVLDQDVIDEIDVLRQEEEFSRSKWAQQAIIRYLAILDGKPIKPS